MDMDYFWINPDRQKFHELAVRNLLDLAQLLVKNHQPEEGLTYCSKALQEDPCNENIHRLCMEIYSSMGNKAAISRQYQHCLKTLKDEFSAPPSEATVSLYKSLMER